jgi:hypothetical protein
VGFKVGVKTLRNPSKENRHYSLNLANAFELTGDITTSYKVHSAWNEAKDWPAGKSKTVQSNKPLDIELPPFEVLTLQADPLR